jgi:hypothetical protein
MVQSHEHSLKEHNVAHGIAVTCALLNTSKTHLNKRQRTRMSWHTPCMFDCRHLVAAGSKSAADNRRERAASAAAAAAWTEGHHTCGRGAQGTSAGFCHEAGPGSGELPTLVRIQINISLFVAWVMVSSLLLGS